MAFTTLLRLLPLLSLLVSAAPVTGPLGGPPVAKSAADKMTLMFANFLENLEYSLYVGGCNNFTDAQYDAAGFRSGFRIEVVCETAKQELVHIETIGAALKAGGASPVKPCRYSFPYSTPVEFVSVANMVTSVGIGAYIGGSLNLTDNFALLTAAASILPVEARHSAALRYGQPAKLSPFPTAFDTALSAVWAYNLALPFVVPGSCPMYLPLPTLPALKLVKPAPLPAHPPPPTPPKKPEFTWDMAQVKGTPKYLAWINQVANVTFEPAWSCGDGCAWSAVPSTVKGVAFVVATDTNNANLTEGQLTNVTLAGPAEVVIS